MLINFSKISLIYSQVGSLTIYLNYPQQQMQTNPDKLSNRTPFLPLRSLSLDSPQIVQGLVPLMNFGNLVKTTPFQSYQNNSTIKHSIPLPHYHPNQSPTGNKHEPDSPISPGLVEKDLISTMNSSMSLAGCSSEFPKGILKPGKKSRFRPEIRSCTPQKKRSNHPRVVIQAPKHKMVDDSSF